MKAHTGLTLGVLLRKHSVVFEPISAEGFSEGETSCSDSGAAGFLLEAKY